MSQNIKSTNLAEHFMHGKLLVHSIGFFHSDCARGLSHDIDNLSGASLVSHQALDTLTHTLRELLLREDKHLAFVSHILILLLLWLLVANDIQSIECVAHRFNEVSPGSFIREHLSLSPALITPLVAKELIVEHRNLWV